MVEFKQVLAFWWDLRRGSFEKRMYLPEGLRAQTKAQVAPLFVMQGIVAEDPLGVGKL